MSIRFISITCKNCGAQLSIAQNQPLLNCDKCGSKFIVENSQDVKTQPQKIVRSKTIKYNGNDISSREKLLKEIQFLKDQYKETGHPSIPKKIENILNKLKKLNC